MAKEILAANEVIIESAKRVIMLHLINFSPEDKYTDQETYLDISPSSAPVEYAMDLAKRLMCKPSAKYPERIIVGFRVTARLIVVANEETLQGQIMELQPNSYFGDVRHRTTQEKQKDGLDRIPYNVVFPNGQSKKLWYGERVYDPRTRLLVRDETEAFCYE